MRTPLTHHYVDDVVIAARQEATVPSGGVL